MQLAGKGQIARLLLIGVVGQQPFGRDLHLIWRRGFSWRCKATENCGKRRPSSLDHLCSAKAMRRADVVERLVEPIPRLPPCAVPNTCRPWLLPCRATAGVRQSAPGAEVCRFSIGDLVSQREGIVTIP